MLLKILAVVAILIVALVIVIATRPRTFHIERSLTIGASQETIFARVNDFHGWSAWSPWEKLDPAMVKTYEGPTAGVGARYAWKGNNKVGEGSMLIDKSEKPSRVVVKLAFLKPFPATSSATFTFAEVKDGTKVTWAMDGEKSFMAKAFHMVVDMDNFLGKDFASGLSALKRSVESAAG